jgi:hypothetical protein
LFFVLADLLIAMQFQTQPKMKRRKRDADTSDDEEDDYEDDYESDGSETDEDDAEDDADFLYDGALGQVAIFFN